MQILTEVYISDNKKDLEGTAEKFKNDSCALFYSCLPYESDPEKITAYEAEINSRPIEFKNKELQISKHCELFKISDVKKITCNEKGVYFHWLDKWQKFNFHPERFSEQVQKIAEIAEKANLNGLKVKEFYSSIGV